MFRYKVNGNESYCGLLILFVIFVFIFVGFLVLFYVLILRIKVIEVSIL